VACFLFAIKFPIYNIYQSIVVCGILSFVFIISSRLVAKYFAFFSDSLSWASAILYYMLLKSEMLIRFS